MNKTVSILGCGWLGLPLAIKLKELGYQVKGSRTNEQGVDLISKSGIIGFKIEFNPVFTGQMAFFLSEMLIISIPPKIKINGEEYFLNQIRDLSNIIESNDCIKKIVFISSTSVYNQIEGDVIEVDQDATHFLTKAEEMIMSSIKNRDIYILRFGGLMGNQRNPCKYLKPDAAHLNSYVNYLHLYDCIETLITVIKDSVHNSGIYNVCSPEHPTRIEILENNCKVIVNHNANEKPSGKKVISQKFIDTFNYKFKFDNPLNFTYM